MSKIWDKCAKFTKKAEIAQKGTNFEEIAWNNNEDASLKIFKTLKIL